MEPRFCQCCGMVMGDTDENYGTEADGSLSTDYCKYCYDKGEFLQDGTMEQMIDTCVPFVTEAHPEMSETEVRKMMTEFFPTLKRWKN